MIPPVGGRGFTQNERRFSQIRTTRIRVDLRPICIDQRTSAERWLSTGGVFDMERTSVYSD